MLDLILIFVIAFGFLFEFINGFHDTANAIATSVYTKALTPRRAIMLAAAMNFLGALVSERVASTISKNLVSVHLEQYVILAALVGAIIWNLLTWWRGIPSSSSHALIGSLVGATIVYTHGVASIKVDGIVEKVIIPLFASPVVGLIVGYLIMPIYILHLVVRYWVKNTGFPDWNPFVYYGCIFGLASLCVVVFSSQPVATVYNGFFDITYEKGYLKIKHLALRILGKT